MTQPFGLQPKKEVKQVMVLDVIKWLHLNRLVFLL